MFWVMVVTGRIWSTGTGTYQLVSCTVGSEKMATILSRSITNLKFCMIGLSFNTFYMNYLKKIEILTLN